MRFDGWKETGNMSPKISDYRFRTRTYRIQCKKRFLFAYAPIYGLPEHANGDVETAEASIFDLTCNKNQVLIVFDEVVQLARKIVQLESE